MRLLATLRLGGFEMVMVAVRPDALSAALHVFGLRISVFAFIIHGFEKSGQNNVLGLEGMLDQIKLNRLRVDAPILQFLGQPKALSPAGEEPDPSPDRGFLRAPPHMPCTSSLPAVRGDFNWRLTILSCCQVQVSAPEPPQQPLHPEQFVVDMCGTRWRQRLNWKRRDVIVSSPCTHFLPLGPS